MRLDKFLHITGLIKRRVLANEACKRGLIMVNGVAGKPTREVKAGDEVLIDLPRRETRLRILQDIPGRSLPRAKRHEFIEIVHDVARAAPADPFWDDQADDDATP
jgi:ribosome-associated heat shock protein Hsp15